MIEKKDILDYLHNYNQEHKKDGFKLVSLFGSYARDENDFFSDIDLTYEINHNIVHKDDLRGLNAVRNFIAHDYDSVDDEILEVVLRNHIPKIKDQILKLLFIKK